MGMDVTDYEQRILKAQLQQAEYLGRIATALEGLLAIATFPERWVTDSSNVEGH